jgi:PKD repeat protein
VRVEEPDATAEGCFNLTVADLNPFVDIEGPAIATEGDSVTFNAVGLLAGGDIDPLSRLEWDFGDGSDPQIIDLAAFPMATQIVHTFNDDGAFTVTVRAFDEDSFAEASLVINVADVGPSAAAEAQYPDAERLALEGVALTLSAEGSAAGNASDPIVRYDWDFGDGETGEGELVQHAWPDSGTYQVRLTVTDEDGSVASDNITVEVANVAPRIFIESENQQLAVGQENTFRLTVQDVDADRPPRFIEWDMGDGTIINNRTVIENYTYAALGEYTVRVRVNHPEQPNEAAETEFTLNVTAAPPQFTLEAPAQSLDQVIRGREGEELFIRVRVDSARLGQNEFDGEVILSARLKPENATFEQDRGDENNNPDARKWAEIRWTPTFYESGSYEIRLEALAPTTETTRTLVLNVQIEDVGSPLLAAIGTDGADGLLNLYRYGVENGALTFERFGGVEVGLGARGLAFDGRNGRRVFVGVPAEGVAVVNTLGRPERQRVVPTGSGTAAVVWGDDRIWALNAEARTISIIDPDTLKIDRTIDLEGVSRPYDMAWVAGDDARIAVVDARDGTVSIFDPGVLDGGDGAPESQAVVGGALDRVVVDADGLLTIADRKTRAIYQLTVDAVGDANPDVTGFSTVFMPRDISVVGDAVLVATDGGIWRLEDGQVEPPANREQVALSIAPLPEAFVNEGGLIIGEADRVYNYNSELERLVGAPGSRMRRLAAFVALEED